jgi:hypothetical protein
LFVTGLNKPMHKEFDDSVAGFYLFAAFIIIRFLCENSFDLSNKKSIMLKDKNLSHKIINNEKTNPIIVAMLTYC